MGVWRGAGRDVLHGLGVGLDELHAATGAPVTARRAWLQAWIDSYPQYEPVAVAVGERSLQQWDAVALLAVRRGRLLDQVVACGHGPSDAAIFAARDEAGAEHLAAILAGDLEARPHPWSLTLLHMAPQDVVVRRLAARLPNARLLRGDVSPVLRVTAGASLGDHVSKHHRKKLSYLRNRMVREGNEPEIEHIRSREEIEAVLPEVERVHRARDRQLGRKCPLDVHSHRAFFRRVILDHASRDELELTVLYLQGRLAAYTICFLDGGVQRIWNTRFDPEWERSSPGKLVIEASVGQAVEAGCDYDFMRGQEGYKSSYANDEVITQELYASSGPVVAACTSTFLGTREGLRNAEKQGGRSARVVAAVKLAHHRWSMR